MSRADTPPYYFDGSIPRTTMPGWAVYDLRRWVETGELPDEPLLIAILKNDLCKAFGHADVFNAPNLHAFVAFVYNEMPAESWGSAEKIRKWAARFGK